MLREKEFLLLYEISRTPGISFNALCLALKGKVSRATVASILKKFMRAGLVIVKRDQTHKQRKLYYLRSDIFRSAAQILRERTVSKVIEKYKILKKSATDAIIRDFLKKLTLKRLEEILG